MQFSHRLAVPVNTHAEEIRGSVDYGLYAVVMHTGTNMGSGHYYAYTRKRCVIPADDACRLPHPSIPAVRPRWLLPPTAR